MSTTPDDRSKGFPPGMSTVTSRRHSSLRQHCRTRRNNLARRTASRVAVLQRIRSHPPQPCIHILSVLNLSQTIITLTWCARQIRSMSCFCRKRETTSGPKVNDTPRSFSLQPVMSLSGSDHSKSHSKPVSGTSVGRITLRICSMLCRSGLSPPCMVKIFSSIMAAMGRQLKQSVKVFHSLILYRRLPVKDQGQPEVPSPGNVPHIHHRNRRYG